MSKSNPMHHKFVPPLDIEPSLGRQNTQPVAYDPEEDDFYWSGDPWQDYDEAKDDD